MAMEITRRAFFAGAAAAAAVAPVAAQAAFDANTVTFEAAGGIPCVPGADIIVDSSRFGSQVAYWFADHGCYVLGVDGNLVKLGEPITVNEGDEIVVSI